MVLPVSPVQPLTVLRGQTNGKLSPDILVHIPGQAGGATITLVAPAARAFRALIGTAKKAGHTLKTNTAAHSYRTYTEQVRIFTTNYTTKYLPGRPSKVWAGRRWYQKPGVPVVALPGTSNHGWGRAVDMGEERGGDNDAEMFDSATLSWLIANEQRFGISHEIQSESWHIRYFAGDTPPAAVLAWEKSQSTTPPDTPDPKPLPKEANLVYRIVWFRGEPTAPNDQPDETAAYRCVYAMTEKSTAKDPYLCVEGWHIKDMTELAVWKERGLLEVNSGSQPAHLRATIALHDGPFVNTP